MSTVDISDITAEALRYDLNCDRLRAGDVVSIPAGADEFFRRRVQARLATHGLLDVVTIVKREPGRAHLFRV